LVNGTTCAKNIPTCPAGTHLVNGATCAKNIPTCPAGTHLVNGTTCAPNTATTARRSPPTANAAGGSDGAAVTHRVPCLLPNGRQGALNRATGTCVPLQ